MKLDDSHLQLILTFMAVASGFYRLVKIETTIHSKIDKLQSDLDVYITRNTGEIKSLSKDIKLLISRLDKN